MKRLLSHAPIVGLALACAVIGFLVARGTFDGGAPPAVEHSTWLSQARPLPQFTLLDHRGRETGPEQLADRWQLLFFGFTHCPDVCPITLQVLTHVRAALAAEGIDPPGVVFVSVDPDRDTPAAMTGYLSYFDHDFVGLTGRTREDILQFTREMGVAVRIGEPDENGHYDVDHTAALFVLNPRAELAAVFTGSQQFPMLHEAGALVHDLQLILGRSR